MRVLIYGINFYPELTGIGKYTGELAAWLHERGHDVDVVTSLPYYPEWQVSKSFSKWHYIFDSTRGFPVMRCPLYVPSKPNGLQRIIHLFSFVFFSFPCLFWASRKRPDVVLVIIPTFFTAPIAWIVARLIGAKCWLHVQDFEIEAAFEMGVLKGSLIKKLVTRFEFWTIRRFDAISTISLQMVNVLTKKINLHQLISLFPNWIDLKDIYPLSSENSLRDELGIASDRIVLLYSGNMGLKQGLEIVIESAKLLIENPRYLFLMCGDGVARSDLQEMAIGLSNIQWLPLQPVERFNELLNLADMHLLPQNGDVIDLVMPSKLTGMLASGRPVIAATFPQSQVAKYVDTAGVIVPPHDATAFVNAIINLAEDPDLRARLGLAGRAIAEAEWEKNKVLQTFEHELFSLVAASTAALKTVVK